MGPGRGLPTLTYKAHWRHWSPSRGVWPRWLFSAAAAQRGGRRVSHTSRATPAAVPVQLGQSQRPSVSKGYRVSTRCSAVLRRLGFHSQEEKEFRLLQNARHPQGKKGGTMSSVERRDWLFGAFTDKHRLWGTHSEFGIILSPRGALRGRKMRLAHGELILQHRGEVPVKGTRRCLKSPLTGPRRRLPASVSL